MSGIDDLDEVSADILADDTPHDGIGDAENTDPYAGLFDSLDPNSDPITSWDLFSPHANDISARLRDDWTHAAHLDPIEASWHALFTGIAPDLTTDPLNANNSPRDPFADPLLNPFADLFPAGSDSLHDASSALHPGSHDSHTDTDGGFDVDSELSRLASLDKPGGAPSGETPLESGTNHTRHNGLSHGHIGGAAAAVGLIGAGLAAPRPIAPVSAPGAGNMDDLDPPDDLDGNNFALFEEFNTEGDIALIRDGGERAGETPRHLRISAAAWEDIANAAAALGARRSRREGPDAAAAFLARIRQSLDMLVRYPEAGLPLPESPAGLPALPADLTDVRIFVLAGAFPCDLYYRVLPDPDGPEGPETEALLALRLLPSTFSDEA
jgi:plasmid stabilization system protein ParE